MKKSLSTILIFLGLAVIYAQTPQDESNTLSGFDGIQWGTSYNEAKDRFRTLASSSDVNDIVNIIADNPGREIVILRKNIRYRYVFYKKPAILVNPMKKTEPPQAAPESTPNQTPAPASVPEPNPEEVPRLFLVESSFPYVPSLDLETRVADKYGKRNGGNLNQQTNRGYFVWTLARGILVQWIDPYKNKPYTRSLYYASKDILDEIRSDFPRYQYTPELKTLMDILY